MIKNFSFITQGRRSRKAYNVLALLLLLSQTPVFSQNKPVQLSAEISAVEKKLSDSKLSASDRKAALETLARLYELSGNTGAAADTWQKAAQAVPGNGGHAALLQSARCFAAIGEFEKAEAAINPVTASADKTLQIRARLLSAQIQAFKTGTTAALTGLLTNPDFAGEKPALYYSLWRISSDPAVQSAMASALFTEYPQSPEALIVRNDSSVNAVPAALWLLAGSEGTAAVTGTTAAQPGTAQPGVTQPGVTQPGVTAAQPGAVPPDAGRAGGPLILQTGIFGLETNAVNMANKLRAAGFSPVTEKRGSDRWVVGVLPGLDYLSTMRHLKDKGFESFPVY